MKKKLLAIVLSVVVLAALLVPVLAISAAAPTATLAFGEAEVSTKSYHDGTVADVIKLPVYIKDNTGYANVLNYRIYSNEGIEYFYEKWLDDRGKEKELKGFDGGTFKDGDIILGDTVGCFAEGGKTYYQIVQTTIGTDGIGTEEGLLGYAYFLLPEKVGTYTFSIKNISCVDDSNPPVAYVITEGADASFKVECKEHNPGEPEEIEAAKCGVAGKAVIKCTACGEVLDTKEIPALEHKWVEDEALYEAPKCGVEGKKYFTCTNEGCPVATKTEKVDALEHEWDNGTADASKVCGETADVTYECTREGCDETDVKIGAEIAHDWKLDESKCEAPKCGVAGKKVYVCQRAGCPVGEKEEPVAALEHIMVEDVEAYEAPKCGVAGKKVYVCQQEGCEHTEDEEVAALEHDFTGEKVVVKNPTADEKGLYTIACVNDGCEEVEEHDIAKLDKVVENDGLYFESDEAVLPEDITIVGDVDADEENNKVEVTFTFASEYATLEGEVKFGMDTNELEGLKNFKIYKVNAAGQREEVEIEINDGILTFNANLEAEYVLEAEIVKTSPETSDAANVAVFAVVALMAVAALVVVGKKRFAL